MSQTAEQFTAQLQDVEGPLGHIVMFSFYETSTDEEIDRGINMCRALSHLPGVLDFEVQESLDQRKGRKALEMAVFRDGQSFLDFRDHPEHQEFAEYIRNHADWTITDYSIPQTGSIIHKVSA